MFPTQEGAQASAEHFVEVKPLSEDPKIKPARKPEYLSPLPSLFPCIGIERHRVLTSVIRYQPLSIVDGKVAKKMDPFVQALTSLFDLEFRYELELLEGGYALTEADCQVTREHIAGSRYAWSSQGYLELISRVERIEAYVATRDRGNK
jgi:hypothetical protein